MKHNTRNPMKPNEYTFTALLNCYASLGLSRKAVRLLRDMHEKHKNGYFANGGGPSVFSYGCVLNALARSRDVDAPERAKELLDQMWTYCDEDGNEALRPNNIIYNSVLNCYAHFGRGTEAEVLLREMEELGKSGRLKTGGPCIISYQTTLNALGKSRDADAPERARTLFDGINSNPKVERTYGAFNSLLLCYSAHGRAKEAELLVREMIDLYICGDLEERPNTTSFNTLMASLASSSVLDKTEIALDILKTMIELRDSGYKDIEPDGNTINIFLKCFGSKGQYKEGKKYIEELIDLAAKPVTPSSEE